MIDRTLADSRRVGTIAIYPMEGASHCSQLDFSALAGYTKSLLGHLPAGDRAEHVIFTNTKTKASHAYMDNGLLVVECWDRGKLRFWVQILKTLRWYRKLQLVHLQHEFNQFGPMATIPFILLLLFLLRVIYKTRIVITFHEVISGALLTPDFVNNTYIPFPPFVIRFLFKCYYRAASRLADFLVVQDQHFAHILEREYGVTTPKAVIHIGVEDIPFTIYLDESRRRLGFQRDDKVLLFFGTIDWRKGIDMLINAFSLLPEGKYKLILAGGQPSRVKDHSRYQEWYHNLRKRFDGSPNVQFGSFVPDKDIEMYFRASDLVVLPYIVPQLESAVINLSISYEAPFITTSSFRGRVDDLTLFEPTSDALAEKIEWCFNGNRERLINYVREEKQKRAWSRRSQDLADIYRRFLPD